jgi:hypothetical protein
MRVAAGRTLIRRYALALTPAGVGNEASITATAVPPLSVGPGDHGCEATHALTIANSGGVGSRPAEGLSGQRLMGATASALGHEVLFMQDTGLLRA